MVLRDLTLPKKLMRFLKEAEVANINPDDPKAIKVHAQIVQKKPLLRDVYLSFYQEFVKVSEKVPPGYLVELGSGGGFLKSYLPSVITSDILDSPYVDRVFSAEHIAFDDSTVAAFFLLDIFHHIKHPRRFFHEVQRCLKSEGRLIMIEPANTLWARFIRKNFHHELHDESGEWKVDGSNPVSDCNLALPWIIFERDRKIFEQEFPDLSIVRYEPHTPFRFLLSGGITYKSLVPECLIPLVKFMEHILSPFNKFLGMHVTIEIQKLKREI